MDPKTDPTRRCLKVADWPAKDRALWVRALAGAADPLDDPGPAAHWSPATAHKNRRGYGRWLTFLAVTARLPEGSEPDERVTREAVAAYVGELQRTVASISVALRIEELYAALRVMAPAHDWGWLRRLATRARARARESIGRKRLRMRSSGELFAWGLARMAEAEQESHLPAKRRAVHFRDGLMIALLAARPLRRRNFAAIALGRHLVPAGDGLRLVIDGHETKSGRPIEFPVPDALVAPLRRYLDHHRDVLLKEAGSDRLWVSESGQPMSEMFVYHRIIRVTHRAFGKPLNPHLFRDCAATSLAIEDPDHVRSAAPLLGHGNCRTTERHYNQAQGLEASRRYHRSLTALRRKLARTERRPIDNL